MSTADMRTTIMEREREGEGDEKLAVYVVTFLTSKTMSIYI